MDLALAGKVALVGGSSRGLGRALAEELAAEGAAVALVARGETAPEEARGALARRSGTRVTAVTADMARPDEPRRVVEAALRDHGRIDVLVTNAGGPPPGPFESHDTAAWLAAVQLTLMSAVELIRAAGRHARRQADPGRRSGQPEVGQTRQFWYARLGVGPRCPWYREP